MIAKQALGFDARNYGYSKLGELPLRPVCAKSTQASRPMAMPETGTFGTSGGNSMLRCSRLRDSHLITF
jgi:hypothetical protein